MIEVLRCANELGRRMAEELKRLVDEYNRAVMEEARERNQRDTVKRPCGHSTPC